MEQLEEAAVRLVLEDLLPDELPLLAAEALARGVDSPALRELAGLFSHEVREARDLFYLAMDELGSPIPDMEEARRRMMAMVARWALKGEMSLHSAAHEVCWQSYYASDSRPLQTESMMRFLSLQSAWEDRPERRAEIEADIRAAMRQLLEELGSSAEIPLFMG
ncbi:hypothetical protein ACTWPT_38825 [Nonomuraea sp. 3N208]|uniref:hypothetical protein n=1 Tax=Nonomuraea sp. 3N208 TaxID=3457421 RepID=UPI003FD0CD84